MLVTTLTPTGAIYRNTCHKGGYFWCSKCDAYEFRDLWFWSLIHRLAHRNKY